MKLKIVKAIALVLAMLCILCFPVPASAISQGTDGTELQVMKPQNLEIRLGEDWAGVEFELTTDAGKYPGVILVGEDGVLRLEIGGSENYILSCLNSTVENPRTGDAHLDEEGTVSAIESNNATEPSETIPEGVEEDSVGGIPVKHIILFAGGMIVAVGTLAGIHFHQNTRSNADDDDDI